MFDLDLLFGNSNRLPELPGLKHITEKTQLDLSELAEHAETHKKLLQLFAKLVPQTDIVNIHDNDYDLKSAMFNINTLFEYVNLKHRYSDLALKLAAVLFTIANDNFYILHTKQDSLLTNIAIIRPNALFNPDFKTVITDKYLYFTGSYFYNFMSLFRKYPELLENYDKYKQKLGFFGFVILTVSNPLTISTVSVNDSTLLEKFNFVNEKLEYILPYSFHLAEKLYVALDNVITDYKTGEIISALDLGLLRTVTTDIYILPDGAVIDKKPLPSNTNSFASILKDKLNDKSVSQLFFTHYLSQTAINFTDLQIANLEVFKSDISTIINVDSEITLPGYCYLTVIDFSKLKNVLIPNVTDKEIIPYMPFSLTTVYTTYSDIIQDWSMIIGKYTPVFTNELYDLRFFTSYIYNPESNCLRTIYEFDRPPLTELEYIYSDVLDYRFDFDNAGLGGPFIIRLAPCLYMIIVSRPKDFTLADIKFSTEPYSYTVFSNEYNNLETIVCYYKTDIFNKLEQSITISYTATNPYTINSYASSLTASIVVSFLPYIEFPANHIIPHTSYDYDFYFQYHFHSPIVVLNTKELPIHWQNYLAFIENFKSPINLDSITASQDLLNGSNINPLETLDACLNEYSILKTIANNVECLLDKNSIDYTSIFSCQQALQVINQNLLRLLNLKDLLHYAKEHNVFFNAKLNVTKYVNAQYLYPPEFEARLARDFETVIVPIENITTEELQNLKRVPEGFTYYAIVNYNYSSFDYALWQELIKRYKILPLLYIDVEHESKSLSTVINEINSYITNYGNIIRGFYINNVSPNLDDFKHSYLQNIVSHIRNYHPRYTIFAEINQLNVDQRIPELFDFIVLFNGDYTEFNFSSVPDYRNQAFIIKNLNLREQYNKFKEIQNRIAAIYITNYSNFTHLSDWLLDMAE